MLIGFALLQALLERQAAMSEHREFEEREAMIFVADGSDSERLEAASRSHRRFWKQSSVATVLGLGMPGLPGAWRTLTFYEAARDHLPFSASAHEE